MDEILNHLLENGLYFLEKYHNDNKFNKGFCCDLNASFSWRKNDISNIITTKNFTFDFDLILDDAFKKAKRAKQAILNVKNPNIYTKKDKSYVTDADLLANKELMRLGRFSVVSEENINVYIKDGKLILPDIFWLVDPLDGTNSYIKHRKDFCICVALVYKERPILGLIYDVVEDLCVYASVKSKIHIYHNKKTTLFSNMLFKLQNKKPNKTLQDKVFLSSSRSLNYKFYEKNGAKCVAQASAIKFLKIALSKYHGLLRSENLSFWDICAGDFLVFASGGAMFCDNGYIKYNQIKMPSFCAFDKSWIFDSDLSI